MSDLGLRAGARIDASAFDIIRRRMCLQHAKWDPQVGDVATLADFPLLLNRDTWTQLATWAERLADELRVAERELFDRPKLLQHLGIPRPLRRAMCLPDDTARVVRFDFHLTPQGWCISEANADVPGGYAESSAFSALMAEQVSAAYPAGDPAAAWADCIAAAASKHSGAIALVSAPGFMEDAQVLAGLQILLDARGLRSTRCNPANLHWNDDNRPTVWGKPVSAIVRFVQAEWLPKLTRHWRRWLTSAVPVLNPLSSAVAESKRFPLVWNDLKTPMPTWRQLLPHTVDPRKVDWRSNDWIVKPAFGNTGDDVASVAFTPAKLWKKTAREVRWHARDWVAQRRFDIEPVDTPVGPRRPCVGVYTIGAKAAGIYGRLSIDPVVDYTAVDVAVLLRTR